MELLPYICRRTSLYSEVISQWPSVTPKAETIRFSKYLYLRAKVPDGTLHKIVIWILATIIISNLV